jgi:hypothetical protein
MPERVFMPDFQPQSDLSAKSSAHRKLVFQQNRPQADRGHFRLPGSSI